MKKKIVAVLLLSLLALPALSSASGKAVDNPFQQIWSAVEDMRIRLTAVENGQAEREQNIQSLEARIDSLTACLYDEENCNLDGGEEGGEEDEGGSEPQSHNETCGKGVCGNSVQWYDGEAVPECAPHFELMSTDVCDGLDNDCDGESDEDFFLLGGACDASADWSNGQYSCDYGIYQCRG